MAFFKYPLNWICVVKAQENERHKLKFGGIISFNLIGNKIVIFRFKYQHFKIIITVALTNFTI